MSNITIAIKATATINYHPISMSKAYFLNYSFAKPNFEMTCSMDEYLQIWFQKKETIPKYLN